MRCYRCGVAAPTLKTVRRRTGGERLRSCCDSCWPEIAEAVWVVPGPVACAGSCKRCGSWVSVRELRERAGGGKWDAPSAIGHLLVLCAEEPGGDEKRRIGPGRGYGAPALD